METKKVTDTARELEEIRRNRIKDHYRKGKKEGEGDETPPEKPENSDDAGEEKPEKQEKTQKKLDKDQIISYINDKDFDQLDEETVNTLEKTFGGDPLKAVKAYNDSNREFMKFRNSTKKEKEYLDRISDIVESNPFVGEILDKAEKDEDIESFIKTKFTESSNDKPTKSQSKSKPNITEDVTDVDEKTLFESGYLDREEKEFMSADEWDEKKRQASIRFMYKEMPKRMAQQGAEEYQKQIERLEEKRKAEATQQRNERLIEERYLNGIETISQKYGLDFVNNKEHRELLEKIEARAAGIPDMENRNVIDEDAIEMATDYILKKEGILDELKVKEPKKPKEKDVYDRNQFNVNKKKTSSNKPKSVSERLRERHLEKYKSGLQRQVVSKNK